MLSFALWFSEGKQLSRSSRLRVTEQVFLLGDRLGDPNGLQQQHGAYPGSSHPIWLHWL